MKEYTEAEVLHRMAGLCSIKEYCAQEIEEKIRKTALPEEACANIISYLQKQNFLDDNRYANAFTKDKFRFNSWGKVRIAYELRNKNIPAAIIEEALANIDEDEYCAQLNSLLKAKRKITKGKNDYDISNKLLRFAAGKGFESKYVYPALRAMFKDLPDEEIF